VPRSTNMHAVDAGSARDNGLDAGIWRPEPARARMSGLASRALVTAVLLPLVIGLVHLGGWWLFGLALAAGLIALHELYVMAKDLRPLVLAGYLGFVVGLLGLQLGGLAWMLGGTILTLFLVFILYGLSDIRTSATTTFGVTLLGVAWIGAGLGLPLLVRDIPDHGFWAVIAILFSVFAADTVAFFVGRTVGRHKMAPAISPGKTWEGFAAGLLAAMAASFLILYRDRDEFLSIPEMLLLGAAVAVAGVFGDLFESAVKRDLGFKDSGRLLGGHGGMLDRIDALLWAGPAAYFVILAVS
jgi:phosphatidate cytidylyltransferase